MSATLRLLASFAYVFGFALFVGGAIVWTKWIRGSVVNHFYLLWLGLTAAAGLLLVAVLVTALTYSMLRGLYL